MRGIRAALLLIVFAAFFARRVEGAVAILHAGFKSAFRAAKRTASSEQFISLEAETVFQLHGDGAAQCVQAENRIGTFDIHTGDRDIGNQVPIHGVAE